MDEAEWSRHGLLKGGLQIQNRNCYTCVDSTAGGLLDCTRGRGYRLLIRAILKDLLEGLRKKRHY